MESISDGSNARQAGSGRGDGGEDEVSRTQSRSLIVERNVKFTSGGLRPPRLLQPSLGPEDMEGFCRVYIEYLHRVNISNEDGSERIAASMRELVNGNVQKLV